MIKLAKQELCTGCAACAYICPKQCITMEEDGIGVVYPQINSTDCVQCGSCMKECPMLNPVQCNSPYKAYAAWSSDEEERRTSASGGVAMEIYKDALKEKVWIGGARQNEDFSVSLDLTEQEAGLVAFKNSKYVYSSALELYRKLDSILTRGEKAIIIALPCQIAAIRKIFCDNDNLLLVDLICHGSTPYSYLKQHIRKIEEEYGEVAKRMSFRDPYTYTYTFTFTLYNSKDERFYAKRTKDGDTYQYGYHRMISYRENCYHCAFACLSRVSDITLGDYNGLGKLAPCSFNALKVSGILVNTAKGSSLIEKLIDNSAIVAAERPIQEQYLGCAMLQHPCIKSWARKEFEKRICQVGGFEEAITPIMQRAIRREQINKIILLSKRIARKIINVVRG